MGLVDDALAIAAAHPAPKAFRSWCDKCHQLDRVAKRRGKWLCKACYVGDKELEAANLAVKAESLKAHS